MSHETVLTLSAGGVESLTILLNEYTNKVVYFQKYYMDGTMAGNCYYNSIVVVANEIYTKYGISLEYND